jgi:hypothetical protein
MEWPLSSTSAFHIMRRMGYAYIVHMTQFPNCGLNTESGTHTMCLPMIFQSAYGDRNSWVQRCTPDISTSNEAFISENHIIGAAEIIDAMTYEW